MSATATQLGSTVSQTNDNVPSWAGYFTDALGNRACVGLFTTEGQALSAATAAQAFAATDGSGHTV